MFKNKLNFRRKMLEKYNEQLIHQFENKNKLKKKYIKL